MGVSTTSAQFSAKLDRLSKDLRDPRVPLNATALHVKRLFEASAAEAGVLNAKIAGKQNAIGVRYDIKGQGQTASATIRYTGPAPLVNNPTKQHRIEPRRARGRRTRRRSGASVLVINGSVRAWANHPGTRGKHFFQKAKVAAQATAPRVYGEKQLTEPLRRIF